MKAKELEDLKKSYKESMDELTTLRTKVCDGARNHLHLPSVDLHLNESACCSVVEMSGGRASTLGGRAEQVQRDHQPAEG